MKFSSFNFHINSILELVVGILELAADTLVVDILALAVDIPGLAAGKLLAIGNLEVVGN
jgi:hypothetical protein